MVIDIRKTAIRMWLRGLIMAFIFSTLILILLLTNLFSKPLASIGKSHVIIFLAVIYLGMAAFNYLRDYHYIYFSDESNKLILRYYSLRPLSQAKKSIEIPKENLVKVEFRNRFMGLSQKLILFQKVKSGVYKYPPVSLTALSSEEKNQLLQVLNSIKN